MEQGPPPLQNREVPLPLGQRPAELLAVEMGALQVVLGRRVHGMESSFTHGVEINLP
jgi:hypothetical protein